MCNPTGQTRVWFMYCFGPKKEYYILPNKTWKSGVVYKGETGLKNDVQPSCLRPTSSCLDIG